VHVKPSMPDSPTEEVCPHCGADLLGEPVPERFQHPGVGTRYARGLAIEIRGVYDGSLFYACPDCWGTWHRFDPTDPLWAAAEKYRARFTKEMTQRRHSDHIH